MTLAVVVVIVCCFSFNSVHSTNKIKLKKKNDRMSSVICHSESYKVLTALETSSTNILINEHEEAEEDTEEKTHTTRCL